MRRCVLPAALLALAACAEPPPPTAAPAAPESEARETIWAVDLVRTLPGAQADYVRSIEQNWAQARRVAAARGAVVSYRALVAPPDTARGWDVMLMTEYADSAAYADREAIFEAIFASDDYTRVPSARPSAEMRTFAAGSVALRAFVSAP